MTAVDEAATLRHGGAQSFAKALNDAMDLIESKSAVLVRSQPVGAAPWASQHSSISSA